MSGVRSIISSGAVFPALIAVAVLLSAPATVEAGAAIVVNTATDAPDANPGDGVCETSTQGECSLRAAIQEANALSGTASITVPDNTYFLSYGSDADGGTDLDITEGLTINGGGPNTIIDANSTDRAIDVSGAGSVFISNVAITNGSASSGDANGGGVRNTAATLQLSNVTVDANDAPNADIGGGGVFNAQGSVNITQSTISGNNVGAGTGGGGAVANDGGTVTFSNSTLSGNSAPVGGSIYNTAGAGEVTATSTTVAESTQDSGGAVHNAGGNVTFHNSMITGSTPDNCSAVSGSFIISTGYSLSSDNTCVFNAAGDLLNTDPLLGPLANNGGATFTHALPGTSPAIDAGDPAPPCSGTDQRGIARPQGARCDIGAFEMEVPLRQGDVDCSGAVDAVDALKILRYSAGLDYTRGPGCPTIGVTVAGFPFGDVDCMNPIVNAVDALKVLRKAAGLDVIQGPGCTPIGDLLP